MRPIVVRVGPLAAAAANAVALAQAGAAGAPLALNGALAAPVTTMVPGVGPGTGLVSTVVATLDAPRRIGITSSGNDSGIAFVVSGLDRAGNPQSETIAGTNAATAQSALDYATVTAIVPSGATAGTVAAGTTAVASSGWVRLDNDGTPQTSLQCVVTGQVTATIEQTLDNPNSLVNPIAPSAVAWFPHPDAQNAVGFSNSIQTNYAEIPLFVRVTLTAGTGSVQMTVAQAGRASPS